MFIRQLGTKELPSTSLTMINFCKVTIEVQYTCIQKNEANPKNTA